jgi:hypothetical protein
VSRGDRRPARLIVDRDAALGASEGVHRRPDEGRTSAAYLEARADDYVSSASMAELAARIRAGRGASAGSNWTAERGRGQNSHEVAAAA